MAYWRRRKGGVYVYARLNGKPNVQVSRTQTKHLDAQPEHNIDAWVQQYTEQYEDKPFTSRNILFEDDDINKYLRQFEEFLKTRGKAKNTYQEHLRLLRQFALDHFVKNLGLKDPNSWAGASIKLLNHMQSVGASAHQINRTNISLRLFHRYLSEEGIVQNTMPLRLRNPVAETSNTPLKYTLTPDDVLKFIQSVTNPQLKILAICGFFFSLRPQETFALLKSDFRGGSAVQFLGCVKAMKNANLYHKLAVNITQQRTNDGNRPPKKHSIGWVCCFNEQAAKILVGIINSHPEEELFTDTMRKIYDLWKESGIKDITLKDLRRSSLYWLGHYSEIAQIDLRNHARHKAFSTTEIYLRRPEEILENNVTLIDLDA